MNFPQLMDLASGVLQSIAFNNFTTGAFGAFFGAWGAQAVISRGQRRQSVKTELNSINAALTLCRSTCSSYVNMKQQHALPALQSIEKVRAQLGALLEQKKASPERPPLSFNPTFDFRTIVPAIVPVLQLERQIFEKISIHSRGLAALNELLSAVRSLEIAIAFREQLIVEYKERKLNMNEGVQFYIGSETSNGTDSRYPDCVNGINFYVDSCIFFSKILADDLAQHATALREKNAGLLMGSLPKVAPVDWSPLLKTGLLPKNETYSKWLENFAQ
jgi:hypothetical protein